MITLTDKTNHSKLLIAVRVGHQTTDNISKRLLEKHWPEIACANAPANTTFKIKGSSGNSIEIKIRQIEAKSRGLIQRRFSLIGSGQLYRSLGAHVGDIVGIARTTDGTYSAELNTERAIQMLNSIPQPSSRRKRSASPTSRKGSDVSTIPGKGRRKKTTTTNNKNNSHAAALRTATNRNQTAIDRRPNKKNRMNTSFNATGDLQQQQYGALRVSGRPQRSGSSRPAIYNYDNDELDAWLDGYDDGDDADNADTYDSGEYNEYNEEDDSEIWQDVQEDFVDGQASLAQRPYAPALLLPTERPLHIEQVFGEGKCVAERVIEDMIMPADLENTQAALQDVSKLGAELPVRGRYQFAVRQARNSLQLRASVKLASLDANLEPTSTSNVQSKRHLLSKAYQISEDFERLCLQGHSTSAEQCQRVCVSYVDMLRQIYGPELILDPHILSAAALKEHEDEEALQLLRCMERRFIIWKDECSGVDRDNNNGKTTVGPCSLKDEPLQVLRAAVAATTNGQADTSAVENGTLESQKSRLNVFGGPSGSIILAGKFLKPFVHALSHPQGQPSLPASQSRTQAAAVSRWDAGLRGIWSKFVGRLGDKTYKEVDLENSDLISCALNGTIWQGGQVARDPCPSDCPVLQSVLNCQTQQGENNQITSNTDNTSAGTIANRLYLTDGSMPDYAAQAYPDFAPGMPCGVDSAVNEMMPHAVASNRGTNLFHALKNESTGTKTFTLFAPVGTTANLTAFHFETKRRRSYNCGAGDLIIQPLATTENIRKLIRVHAAVAGCHTRHGQLFPLECYLEEGIKMVLHVRDYETSSLCELPEQSMHAFISFGTIACKPPALKVSCNDFDLVWEVDSAYWLEKLATVYASIKSIRGEGIAEDGADTWVQSSYLSRYPCTTLTEQPHHPQEDQNSGMYSAKRTEGDKGGGGAPWMCELQENQAALDTADEEIQDDSALHWTMDIIAVRLAEKLLDISNGVLTQEKLAPWAGELPTEPQIMLALDKLRRVLKDMIRRALSEKTAEFANRDGDSGCCHFSMEYLSELCVRVDNCVRGRHIEMNYGLNLDEVPLNKRQEMSSLYSIVMDATVGAGTTDAYDVANKLCDEGLSSLRKYPPGVLRALWLLQCQREWEAARNVEERLKAQFTEISVDASSAVALSIASAAAAKCALRCSWEQLAVQRHYRSLIEEAWDLRCGQLVEELNIEWKNRLIRT